MNRNLNQGEHKAISEYAVKHGFKFISSADFPKYKEGKFNIFQKMLFLHRNSAHTIEFEQLGFFCKYYIKFKPLGDTMYIESSLRYGYD